ncbi:hypothetical protein VP1G_06023 [Cytospora mali]|uniref:Uncharacterized protein n=1 Tax=Cytospora mali TaxID=578113 RepID=A0A194V4D1_CYTMA|nr:hypothetical protein VP1G_06023 [Valsa mali var. pyri (nom. inval.)]
MDIANAKTRLRRTFHYPTDDSSNAATPDVLDEEEQEDLIQALAEQNETHNQQYQTFLLALPIVSSIPYLLALFRPPTLLVALLGLTSLASTGFLLLSLPPTETGMAVLDAWAKSGPSGSSGSTTTTSSSSSQGDADTGAVASGTSTGLGGGIESLNERRRRRRRSSSSFNFVRQKSPLEMYLPYLNVGLCVVLVLYGLLARRGGSSESGGEVSQQFGLLGLGNLTAIVYGVVIVAKLVMASVDPERELASLKYEFKGA